MKNRTIPFGYQYENGVLAINPPEAHTVQKVFTAYLSGEPLSKIAAHLTAKLVEYLPGYWKWDKARVKRLLDNANYIGNGEYPPIIKEKDFQMAHQKKDSANTNRQIADEDIKAASWCGGWTPAWSTLSPGNAQPVTTFFLCQMRNLNIECSCSNSAWWPSPC